MALLQLLEVSFVEGRCPNCDDHLHSARSVRSGKMMPFDNPLTVVRTETLTSTTRATAVVDGDALMCHSGPTDGGSESTPRTAHKAVVRENPN
jgi:hypothetical protein